MTSETETHSQERKRTQAENQIKVASRKFLAKLGGNKFNPFLFQYLNEAAQDFNCDLNSPCDPTDICFIMKEKKPSAFVSVKAMREFYNEHHKPEELSNTET